MDYKAELEIICKKASKAARELATFSTNKKNKILEAMSEAILNAREEIQAANEIDLKNGEEAGLSSAMIDRLRLNDARIDAMAKGLTDVAGLQDPAGIIESNFHRPNGLHIEKVRVPIGVIGIIYESRPNVTVDATALCFKAGNIVILRGGKEAFNSNKILVDIMQKAGEEAGLPDGTVQLIPWTDREAVDILLKMDEYINLIIPRGGEGLIRAVAEKSTIPVIKHYKGVCHVYVDATADMHMANDIIINAKCQRPGVCNAVETVLIHKDIAPDFIPVISKSLKDQGVEIRGNDLYRQYDPDSVQATEQDWYDEYLELILAVRVVDSIDEAIEHIADYGSGHSDAIVSADKMSQIKFRNEVDSAAVYINASTRFTDGAMFGMGAEIGISTDRLHARGPMGLAELTTYKYIVNGEGQIRD